ncbi:tyrosine-type recombinase/integrase [Paenibacillus periandrae]|uniref:tyrosine-type recombinase/integrase n=1 Tax=Paenibacillus periandrae TaxID=1761741 RepID=UPI001F0959F9|nr:site-specific integrase [Paenibacillus periandrae]
MDNDIETMCSRLLEAGINLDDLDFLLTIFKKNDAFLTICREFRNDLDTQVELGVYTGLTAQNYTIYTEKLIDYIEFTNPNMKVYEIDVDFMTNFTKEQSISSQDMYHSIINTILTYAYERGYATHLFKINWSRSEEAGSTVDYITQEVFDKLVAQAKRDQSRPMDIVAIQLLMYTGCTTNELVTIRVGDVDLEKRTITIQGKSKRKERNINISEQLYDTLSRYFTLMEMCNEKDRILLSTYDGKAIQAKKVQAIAKRLFEKAGLERHNSGSFRDTYAINSIRTGSTIEEISYRLGLTTTIIVTKYMVYWQSTFPNEARQR